MRRPFAMLLFALLALGAVRPGAPAAGPLEDAAREARRPLIVRFGLDRCLPCIRQAEVFAEVGPRYEGRIDFRFVHVRDEEELAEGCGVLLVPTVIVFDAAGRERFRHVGLLGGEEVEIVLRDLGLLTPTRAD